LNSAQFTALRILKEQRLSNAQRLAVDLESPLSGVVLNPEVIADGEEALAHPIVVVATPTAAELSIFLALVAPFFPSASA
jgi:hypothetical protein